MSMLDLNHEQDIFDKPINKSPLSQKALKFDNNSSGSLYETQTLSNLAIDVQENHFTNKLDISIGEKRSFDKPSNILSSIGSKIKILNEEVT